MKEAKKGIESHRVANAGQFLAENAVPQREQGVDRIAGRAAITSTEIKRLAVVAFQHGGEMLEINGCSGSLQAE